MSQLKINKSSGFVFVPLLIMGILAVVLATGGVYFWQQNKEKKMIKIIDQPKKARQVKILSTEPKIEPTAESGSQNELKEKAVDNHLIPADRLKVITDFDKNIQKQDCIIMQNCDTEGGDLLSSLVYDDEFRNKLPLKKYTKDYLTNLKQKIDDYSKSKMSSDLFAAKVCNVGDGIDVVSGYLWPIDQSRYEEEGKFVGNLKAIRENPAVFLIKDSKVVSYEDIQICSHTATGGESYPCGAKLVDNKIEYSCFMVLAHAENGDVVGSEMKYWSLDFEGSKPEAQEAVELNVSNIKNSNFSNINTSDWKTYRNEKLGFEFKYPKDYHVLENNENGVSIYSPGEFRKVELQAGTEVFPVDINVVEYMSISEILEDMDSYEKIVIAGQDSIMLRLNSICDETIYVPTLDQYSMVEMSNCSQESNIFIGIYSTFKFIVKK